MRIIQITIITLTLTIASACVQHEAVQSPVPQQQTSEVPSLSNFFMPDGTEAEYLGEGNEYAHYLTRTQWLSGRYVNIIEDNGGTVLLRTFRIEEDRIVVVREEGEAYDAYAPAESELDQLEPLYTYLQLPLKKGSEFEGWQVLEDGLTLLTPYKQLENVIVIEKQEGNQSISRKYFAAGMGEVKREFIMQEGTEEYTVSSTLEKIK